MSGRSWFSWNRTQNVHSLDRLRQLYSLLTKNKAVTQNNKALVVEVLFFLSTQNKILQRRFDLSPKF